MQTAIVHHLKLIKILIEFFKDSNRQLKLNSLPLVKILLCNKIILI